MINRLKPLAEHQRRHHRMTNAQPRPVRKIRNRSRTDSSRLRFGGKNRFDNSHNNVDFDTERDPFSGLLRGVRITGCRVCGRYPSLVMSASGTCGRQSCIKRRKRMRKSKR